MTLYAISDLHVDRDANWRGLQEMPAFPGDWLVVAGDLAETEDRFTGALDILTDRFARVFWTPGNHDLWTRPPEKDPSPLPASDAGTGEDASAETLRGAAKYNRLVALCRSRNVHTPEDPFVSWPDGTPVTELDPDAPDETLIIAPTFTLYDYTFSPDHVQTPEDAVAWAEETDCVCSDEILLHPDPHATRAAWCLARCRATEKRLRHAAVRGRIVLANHYPLREEHAVLPRIPRFTPWCGTTRTRDWPTRFRLHTVVYGHLHIPTSHHIDGTDFHEVSLGYPSQWSRSRGLAAYLHPILET